MKKIVFVLSIMLIATPIYAETVVLKSGKTVEGKILEKTDKYIKLDLYGVNLIYFFDEIATIDGKIVPAQPAASIQLPASGSVDKNKILEQIKQARGKISRMHTDSTQKLDMEKIMSMENETVSDIDFDQKIIRSSVKIKDLSIKIDDMMQSGLEAAIAKARKQGVPEEEINRMKEESLKTINSLRSEVTQKMTEGMKKLQTESYISKDALYMGINNNWFKIPSVLPESFWQIMQSVTSSDKQEMEKTLSNLPEQFKEIFQAMFGSFGEDYNDIVNIGENTVNGKSLYILKYDDLASLAKIKDVFKAVTNLENQGFNPDDISFDSCVKSMFISKETFRPLGSQLKLKAHLSSQQHPDLIMNMNLLQEVFFSYPTDKLQLPAELENAKVIDKEQDFNDVIKEEMMKNQQIGI
jgi:hypothetical protein